MKRVLLSVGLSLLAPGIGQFYNRQVKKGVGILLASIVLFLTMMGWILAHAVSKVPSDVIAPTKEMMEPIILETFKEQAGAINIIFILFLALWAYAITDSYFIAKEIDRAENPQVEPEDDEGESR